MVLSCDNRLTLMERDQVGEAANILGQVTVRSQDKGVVRELLDKVTSGKTTSRDLAEMEILVERNTGIDL